MARFSKGTTDHDGDGHMGGSRKGGSMAKTAKKKAPAKPRISAGEKARIEQEKASLATTMDPQTGQSVVNPEKPTKAALAERRSAMERQFAEADGEGQPTTEDVKAASLGRAMRGY